MGHGSRIFRGVVLLAPVLALWGCASVPKEVAQLSFDMGKDLHEVQQGYKAAVHEQFQAFRAERLAYYELEWKPLFIANWVADGRLTDIAAGQVVWSKTGHKFVAPAPGKPKEAMLASIKSWASSAVTALDDKRQSLMAPLDTEEAALMASVDACFDRLYRANNAVTAQLISLRRLNSKDGRAELAPAAPALQAQIQADMTTAAEHAKTGLAEIRKADNPGQKPGDMQPEGL